MTSINEYQLNAILGCVWGQGTSRLTTERPNGDRVTDVDDRVRRSKRLHRQPDTCPHWAAYRARAEPLVAAAACALFEGEPAETALLRLFQQLQTGTNMGLMRRISQHPDLDYIVEADVWPWLEAQLLDS